MNRRHRTRRPGHAAPLIGAAFAALALGAAMPAAAHPGGWGGEGWGRGAGRADRWDGDPLGGTSARRGRGALPGDPRGGPPEDRVTVSTFVTEDAADAARLRTGTIAVTAAPGEARMAGAGPESGELAVYAAAVVDQLARVGYRTDVPDGASGQVTELRIGHATLVPEEVKKPVSGEMAVGLSNRGTAYGLALNVDLSRPRSALISTTLEARIRDRASGRVLWEGRADIATREGGPDGSAGAIASRLAAALFDRFPLRGDPPS